MSDIRLTKGGRFVLELAQKTFGPYTRLCDLGLSIRDMRELGFIEGGNEKVTANEFNRVLGK